jgi:hypothetical protein
MAMPSAIAMMSAMVGQQMRMTSAAYLRRGTAPANVMVRLSRIVRVPVMAMPRLTVLVNVTAMLN